MKRIFVLLGLALAGLVVSAKVVDWETFQKIVYDKYGQEVYYCKYEEFNGDIDAYLNWLYYNGQCF